MNHHRVLNIGGISNSALSQLIREIRLSPLELDSLSQNAVEDAFARRQHT